MLVKLDLFDLYKKTAIYSKLENQFLNLKL